MSYHILTVGNPNSGKTTLFNVLTGAKQRVGNWAGVTVDKKTGQFTHKDIHYELTDLPGIYSLDSGNQSNSLDEVIAAKAAMIHPSDLIINIVDATTLERSLYVTLQLRELGRPMIVVLNKMDALARERKVINIKRLERQLGCKVLCVSATDKASVTRFKNELVKITQSIKSSEFTLSYPSAFETAIANITPLFAPGINQARAMAIRALEGDSLALSQLSETDREVVDVQRKQLNDDIEFIVADTKYGFLHQLCKNVRRHEGKLSTNLTEKIDNFILNKWLGIPFFFVVMYVMFLFSVNIGSAFIDFFDMAVGAILVDGGHQLLDGYLPVWLVTLVVDGIGGGIQTVCTFIPVVASLYLFLSLLESSGYMSRAAFVLDKVMQKIGLPGKAFVPLVLGFGCNVPAIMATRTLDQERERRLAASMAPFMSCGARLPVYALFATAFFPSQGQNVVFLLYLLGIFAAIFTGLILKKTLYPGGSDSFIMEMPNYEFPTVQNILIKTWQKLKRFVLGAGKTIVLVVTLLTFINSLGTDGSFGNQDSNKSVLSHVAQSLTPVFAPMGIQEDNWQATVGIITGIFAKEAVVGTLNSLYTSQSSAKADEISLLDKLKEAVLSVPTNLSAIALSDPLGIDVGDLSDKEAAADQQSVDGSVYGNLTTNFVTGDSAFAYLIFILLYTPCVAAMGAYVREFGKHFARFIAVWTMGLAYCSATFFYQLSQITHSPIVSVCWLVGILSFCVLVYWGLKHQGKKVLVDMPLEAGG